MLIYDEVNSMLQLELCTLQSNFFESYSTASSSGSGKITFSSSSISSCKRGYSSRISSSFCSSMIRSSFCSSSSASGGDGGGSSGSRSSSSSSIGSSRSRNSPTIIFSVPNNRETFS